MTTGNSTSNPYQKAYEREKKARIEAEGILERKSLELFTAVEKLKEANEALNRQRSSLVQTEKLAAIGQLSAGIAHEINNPLAFVISNFNTLHKYYQLYLDVSNMLAHSDEADFGAVKQILLNNDFKFISMDTDLIFSETNEGLMRIQEIIKNLKNFSHSKPEARESVDVNEAVISALSIVKNQIKYHCSVVTELEKIPSIHANKNELMQVIINIVMNASQAILESGEISIKTYVKDKNACITITDNGRGIPKENLGRIFDPFYTSKPVGEGTGLGLSVSYGIIQEFGGGISATSVEGKGTTMKICLPIEQRSEARAK
ncbi:MAG: hypothetical protein K6L73_14040 [Cellvibrionaceae bacterium]